jgi:hypothetical protein
MAEGNGAGIGSFGLRLGRADAAHVFVEVAGYEHPDVAEPQGFDLLDCRVHARAEPVDATFAYSVRVVELLELRAYLAEINAGSGPPATFAIAGGLLNLSFAPSRRGPVLCAVLLKSIEASHVRLEFMVTLEPEDISGALGALAKLPAT